MRLVDKYRPSTFDDVVGQPKIINKLESFRARGCLSGRAYWISGSTGTGKTTIARIIANHICESFNIVEIDANDCTMDALRKIESSMSQYGLGEKSGIAFIINESHGLRSAPILKLNVMLDDIPDHVVFIFTTTKAGQLKLFEDSIDADALLGRCTVCTLSAQGLARVFAEHARDIANKEGLNGKPIEAYLRLAKDHRNNLRAMLQTIDDGGMME